MRLVICSLGDVAAGWTLPCSDPCVFVHGTEQQLVLSDDIRAAEVLRRKPSY